MKRIVSAAPKHCALISWVLDRPASSLADHAGMPTRIDECLTDVGAMADD
jgi:hypothetical protein